MSGVTEQPPRVHPILALPLLPFVLARDVFRWIGRQLERGLAAVGRLIWWLLFPVRWLCVQIGHGLLWLARQIGRGLAWFGRLVGPAIGRILLIILKPFVFVSDLLITGLAWVWRGIAAAAVWIAHGIAAAARWVWRWIGPLVVGAWRTAEWMATKIWRGIAAIGRGIAWTARVIYWPIRPFVRAAAAAGRAVRNSYRSMAASVRQAFGIRPS